MIALQLLACSWKDIHGFWEAVRDLTTCEQELFLCENLDSTHGNDMVKENGVKVTDLQRHVKDLGTERQKA